MDKETFELSIIVLLSIMLGADLSVWYLLSTSNPIITYSQVATHNDIGNGSNCITSDLFNTSRCLNQELNSFYKYNISQVNKTLTEEQIRTEGAVCDQFADWYMGKLKGSDFYSQRVVFNVENDTASGVIIAHAVVIASDKTGYCLFSNQNLNCWRFG